MTASPSVNGGSALAIQMFSSPRRPITQAVPGATAEAAAGLSSLSAAAAAAPPAPTPGELIAPALCAP